MDATALFIIGIAAAGLLAAAAIFAIAYRRGPEAGPMVGELDRKAVRLDRAARKERAERAAAVGQEPATAVAVLEREDTAVEVEELTDPITERVELTESEFGVTRRTFFNRALSVIFGVFLLQFAIASLAFLWPKLKGGFGTPINAGKVDDIRRQVLLGDGSIQPLFVAAAQSWVVPFTAPSVAGTSFENTPAPVVAGDGAEVGLMALWQRCVHLGCRVPECISSQGFECPCHGSKYNFHGEYHDGPAPRNMDRFAVSVNDAGDFIIETGTVIQTSRAKELSIAYPQGPSCL